MKYKTSSLSDIACTHTHTHTHTYTHTHTHTHTQTDAVVESAPWGRVSAGFVRILPSGPSFPGKGIFWPLPWCYQTTVTTPSPLFPSLVSPRAKGWEFSNQKTLLILAWLSQSACRFSFLSFICSFFLLLLSFLFAFSLILLPLFLLSFFSQLCNATGDTDGLMLLYDSTYCSAPKFQTFSQEPWREAENVLFSPCLESQGCHLIPLYYLLSGSCA